MAITTSTWAAAAVSGSTRSTSATQRRCSRSSSGDETLLLRFLVKLKKYNESVFSLRSFSGNAAHILLKFQNNNMEVAKYESSFDVIFGEIIIEIKSFQGRLPNKFISGSQSLP